MASEANAGPSPSDIRYFFFRHRDHIPVPVALAALVGLWFYHPDFAANSAALGIATGIGAGSCILLGELLRIWSQDRKLVVFVTHDIEEAVLLGDRVLVMTGRPGRIRKELTIHLKRPRDPDRDRIAVSDLRSQIWQLLEAEVRRALSMPV